MKDYFDKTVYVVDLESGEIINTCKNEEALRKRLPLLKEPYKGSVSFYRVKHGGVHFLDTEERKGYEILYNILLTAAITGVSFHDAIAKAISFGAIEKVNI